MIALTQEKREKLIAYNKQKLKGLKHSVKQTAFESVKKELGLEIQSTEVALASLKADVAGHIFHDGTQFYHHPSSTMDMAKAQGENAIALYTVPPVPEIKFPSRELIKEVFLANGFKEKVQIDGTSDLNTYVYDAALALIERLNGLGE